MYKEKESKNAGFDDGGKKSRVELDDEKAKWVSGGSGKIKPQELYEDLWLTDVPYATLKE